MRTKVAEEEYRKRIDEARQLLGRLHKGKSVINQASKDGEIALANSAIKLYNSLAQNLFTLLEESLMLHENLSTGRTIGITREGRAVNIDYMTEGETDIDPWTLLTLRTLKDVFGEEVQHMITIESEPLEH